MTSPFSNLVQMTDLLRWQEECARIDAEIAELAAKREKFAQMIELAKEFVGKPIEAERGASDKDGTAIEPPEGTPPRLKKGGSRRREDTWKSAVELIVKAHPEGIAYDKIKEQVPERLKRQLEQFPAGKGFYTALRKLEETKVIVRRNGFAFTRKGFAAYQRKVAAGQLKEIATGKRGSPMEDAIKEFLRDNGASKGVEIRAHLIQFDEFASPVLRNSSAMYNVLLRLKKSEEILHDEEAATYSLAQENGAPASAGAPEAGEAPTSPNDTGPLFRVVQ